MKVLIIGIVRVILVPVVLAGIALIPLMIISFSFSIALSYGAEWAVFIHENANLEGVKLGCLAVSAGCFGIGWIYTWPLVDKGVALIENNLG